MAVNYQDIGKRIQTRAFIKKVDAGKTCRNNWYFFNTYE